MKKFFVFAAAAAFALVACNKDNHTVQGSGNQGGDAKVAGLVLNELSGADKYIELYNTTDKDLPLHYGTEKLRILSVLTNKICC